MKRILLLLLFSVGFANAQIVNIPDTNFKDKLLQASPNNGIAMDENGHFSAIDTNNDGEIQESEALVIIELRITASYYSAALDIYDMAGIEAFSNLQKLVITNYSITSFDISQNIKLEFLFIRFPSNSSLSNSLTNLDISQNIALTYLLCSLNRNITEIDISQNVNLEKLYLHHNQLSDLDISQNQNLKYLNFAGNNITSIEIVNNQRLENLVCEYNQISSLDLTQNPNLRTLTCGGNNLLTLDVSQNSMLYALVCNNNQLETIDVSQNSNLSTLVCSSNNLSTLDVSQNSNLYRLECDNNQLETLDVSQNSMLDELECNNNQLETLFIKNGINEYTLEFENNPNLAYICADDDQIADIQVNAGNSVVVSSYCSFTPGGDYNTISGTVTFDANNNGCDTSDVLPLNFRINIDDGISQGSAVSNSLGNYSFYTEAGSFDITPSLENSSLFSVTPLTVNVQFVDANNNNRTQDFCLIANGMHPDVEVVILPLVPAQPGFDAVYNIVYKNKGNQTVSGSIDYVFDDSVSDYISATINPDSQVTGNLSWNYTDLLPFESRSIEVTLNVNSPMETPAVNIGDVLNFTVIVNPISGDDSPDDNVFDFNQTVVGSYDPNDKICLQGNYVTPESIGDYLHYVINFENTGTAAASFVVITDEIDDDKFDINTFQIIRASHEMATKITGHKIEFIFDAINLGANEKGYVVFKIKTESTLVLGDDVSNKADIYFDYNFPIETNIANTIFQNSLSVSEFGIENAVLTYPNPTKGILNIASQSLITSIELFDVQGKKIKTIFSKTNMLNMNDVTEGIYFLKINTDNGTLIKKIIKE